MVRRTTAGGKWADSSSALPVSARTSLVLAAHDPGQGQDLLAG